MINWFTRCSGLTWEEYTACVCRETGSETSHVNFRHRGNKGVVALNIASNPKHVPEWENLSLTEYLHLFMHVVIFGSYSYHIYITSVAITLDIPTT